MEPLSPVLISEITEFRHTIHKNPETAFEETKTSDFVAGLLETWGITVHRGMAKTGVVGVLKNGTSEKSVALRADMDALDILEASGKPYASQIPGKMHACGHDGHTAMLLGAAKYLAETKNFDGTVYFIFQPAEEGAGGASFMVADGLFDKFPADSIFALHNWPGMKVGEVAVMHGPMMASADSFRIVINGKGGHAAIPHLAVDPIVVAANLITTAQTLVSRVTDPCDKAVVSFTKIEGGSAENIIPDNVSILGTIRTFDSSVRTNLMQRLEKTINSVCETFGATGVIEYYDPYPPTINTPAEADFAAGVAAGVPGVKKVDIDAKPSMGAEDFSYYLEKKPGAYIWVGQTYGSLHHPAYDFNDEIIPIGVNLLVGIAEEKLKK